MAGKAEARDPRDPRGLIRESYRIEGITAGQCRSIFLDWALGTLPGRDTQSDISSLLSEYREAFPDHPMTKTLSEGTESGSPGRRRGGRMRNASRRGQG